MPINAKTGDSWVNGTPYIKTSGSWSPAKQVFAKIDGTWQTVYTSSVFDDFNRANSGSLGTIPSSDYVWTNTDGSWQILNNKAYTATSASAYPMADVEFSSQNVSASISFNTNGVSQSSASANYGAGIAFWIVDSQNWWAVYNDATLNGSTVYTCASTYNGKPLQSGQGTQTCVYDYAATASTSTSYYCSAGTLYSNFSSSTSPYTSSTTVYNVCVTATQVATASLPSNCPKYSNTVFYVSDGSVPGGNRCFNSFSYQGQSSSTSTTYSCPSGGSLSGTTCLLSISATTSTNYSYVHKLKLINSISNSIAQVQEYTLNTDTWVPASLQISTNNTALTIRAYANDDLTGSSSIQTYTATGDNRGTRHGVMIGPKGDSLLNQASSIDNFAISAV